MSIFNKKSHQEFICMFSSNRHMREETDKSLYFNTQKQEFFVVEQTEYESGPNVSVSHTPPRRATDEEARSIVRRDPEWETKASRFFSGN